MVNPRLARAQGSPFSVPNDCSTEEDFRQLVRDRLPPGVKDVPPYAVSVRADGDQFKGELQLTDPSPRQLLASTCVQILDAMAIILALRAERLREEQLRHEAGTASTPSAGWLPSTSPASDPVSDVRPPPKSSAAELAGPKHARRSTIGYRLGAGATVLPDVLPGTALGPHLLAAVVRRGERSWSLRLGLERAGTTGVRVGPAGVWARLSLSRLTGCALEVSVPKLRLTPCLQVAAGILQAGGEPGGPISSVDEIRRPWVSVGPALRAELECSSHLILGAEAAMPFRLVSQTLRFQSPDIPIHESSLVSMTYGLTAELVLGRSKPDDPGIAP